MPKRIDDAGTIPVLLHFRTRPGVPRREAAAAIDKWLDHLSDSYDPPTLERTPSTAAHWHDWEVSGLGRVER